MPKVGVAMPTLQASRWLASNVLSNQSRRRSTIHAALQSDTHHVTNSRASSCDSTPGTSGRTWATAVCAASCTAALLISSPAIANPYLESKKTIQLGVTADGTIRSCQGNVNPNCVSTASTNELYGPVWRAPTRTSQEAAQALETTVLARFPDWRLAQSYSYEYGEYRAFIVPSLFGQDILEILIKDESVNNRNWEGNREGPFVTYRSLAGSVKYVWPIQQPLSDFGAQKTRLHQLREVLGWQVIGCELMECYVY